MRYEDHLVGDRLVRRLLHVVDQGVKRLLASAHLLHGDQVPLVVHMQDGLDVEQRARPGGRLGHASAAEQEHQVIDGEPVGEVELVLLEPVAHLVDRLPGARVLHRVPDEQPLAAGCRKRIDHVDFTLGELLLQLRGHERKSLVGARQAARERDVEHVAAAAEQLAEERLGFGEVGKRRLEDLALAHHGVELLEVGALAFEVALVHLVLAVDHEGQGKDVDPEIIDHILEKVAA